MKITRQQIQGIGMTSQRTRDRMVSRLRDQGVDDEQVLSVFSRMPRHLFVDEVMASRAYDDTALPIGHGQTISQPYIVARMTQLLLGGGDVLPVKRVLEVGTGSGYQAAILACLVDEVVTVERIQPLFRHTQELFHALGFNNIQSYYGDGGHGWEEGGSYDGIIVTAAAETLPEDLMLQLVIGGRLVIPLVDNKQQQRLTVVTRGESEWIQEVLEPVRFVPFLPGCV